MTPTPSPSPAIAQALTESAPWWGVPVIAGLFLLFGGVLGYIFNRANESRRIKREDKQRFDDRILEFAVDLVSLSQEVTLKARSLHRVSKEKNWPEASKMRLEVADLVRRMFTINGALFIIAPSTVSYHSQELVNRATETMAAEGEKLLEATRQQNGAVADFVNVVRSSIGIDAHLQASDPATEETRPANKEEHS